MAKEIKIKTRKSGNEGSVVVDPWEQEISISGTKNLPTELHWTCKYQFEISALDPAHFEVTNVQAVVSGNEWVANTPSVKEGTPTDVTSGYTIKITKPATSDVDYPSERDITVDPDYRVRP